MRDTRRVFSQRNQNPVGTRSIRLRVHGQQRARTSPSLPRAVPVDHLLRRGQETVRCAAQSRLAFSSFSAFPNQLLPGLSAAFCQTKQSLPPGSRLHPIEAEPESAHRRRPDSRPSAKDSRAVATAPMPLAPLDGTRSKVFPQLWRTCCLPFFYQRDESAIVSLKALIPDREPMEGMLNYGPESEERQGWSAEQKKADEQKTLFDLKTAAKDPLPRRLVTAHVLATESSTALFQ